MEEQPNRALATFPRRLAAYLLDILLFFLPLTVFPFAFVFGANTNMAGPEARSMNDPVTVIILVIILVGAAMFVGSFIWWLAALRSGRTPGKQLLGIRVIKANGDPSGWGYTFLRELVSKALLVLFLTSPIWGNVVAAMIPGRIAGPLIWFILVFADNLWALFNKNRQTLHDKIMRTLVVRGRP